jgi:ketosteroid isomerase-like protein
MTAEQLETNKQLVRDFMRAFSTGDVDKIDACLGEDATYWISGTIEGMSGTYDRAGLRALLSGVTDVYTAGALAIETVGEMTAEGDRVAAEASSHAELKNGKVYSCLYHYLFVIRDGKIAQVKEYLDTQHAYDTFYT